MHSSKKCMGGEELKDVNRRNVLSDYLHVK